jgi:RNA polymerase-binding transcription factor DksA
MALTPQQRQELRKRILDRRRQLAAELRGDAARSRAEQYGTLAGATHDRGDESVADLLVDVGQAELNRDLAELRDLEVARMRIEGGSYGTCTDCGAEIPLERLHANPAAIRCMACQIRFEKTHAGAGGPKL